MMRSRRFIVLVFISIFFWLLVSFTSRLTEFTFHVSIELRFFFKDFLFMFILILILTYQ